MKIVFTIQPDHIVDIITNSSSELFVLKGETKDAVKSLIAQKYPKYLNEYQEVKSLDELDQYELQNYLYYYIAYNHNHHCRNSSKDDYYVPPGISFDEFYQRPSWCDNMKNNQDYEDYYVMRDDIPLDKMRDIIRKLHGNNDPYFLFSLSDNPDYDYQLLLEEVGERYHLG